MACEHCSLGCDNEPILYVHSLGVTALIDPFFRSLIVRIEEEYGHARCAATINYCPMCGGKLDDANGYCSTDAFEPKEPSKTCGNCGNAAPAVWCNPDGRLYLIENIDASRCPNYHELTDALEQRCERLGQVAKRMYGTMRDWYQLLDAADTPCGEFLVSLHDQLEALGVNIDD